MSTKQTKQTHEQFKHTSGATDPVWLLHNKYDARPEFQPLNEDIETDVCVIGAGIAGIQIAYELVLRGKEVVLIEARDVLAGETGRTTGHLSNALDDQYTEIKKKHGTSGAQIAADSHTWALKHVGQVTEKLGIECEYRTLPGYEISQYEVCHDDYEQDISQIKEEAQLAKQLGINAEYRDDLTVKGWDGKPNQRGGAVFHDQATFHPTDYLVGVLNWLKSQPNFRCFTYTRAMSVEEKGIEVLGLGHKYCRIETESGKTIQCEHAVEATNVPLQKLSVIAQMEYNRTYAIAIRVPKGSVEDCLLYDSAEEYKYVRLTHCDDSHDYLVVGGCDHEVGQEDTSGRFQELEDWTRARFTQASSVDYKWSGQIFEPVDYMAYIGKNQGCKRIYIVTGDSGNGLTHGVIAGRLIADEIEGKENEWATLYSPKRLGSMIKSLPETLAHDLQINAQYKRLAQSDIQDIEDLVPGSGGVLNPTLKKPTAVYKDENGNVTKLSALCPHMKGVVCWNKTEKSWDCPVHGSRFSATGLCVQGPAKGNLGPVE
ncbi:Uu.00g132780.m01.CDS01 [Anthostomella pinea]|uniref:Uu.00g132780.m01.CDS01 n=1 Tax=Anthostomella pinea TaxID=933095 RepID=A0AAI8VTP5_9PEZI|nr:Uu.00g132780.m01.CDS01 [Anthostomella pinea]